MRSALRRDGQRRRRQELRGRVPLKIGFDDSCDVVAEIHEILLACRHDRQHAFHESTSRLAPRSGTHFSPDDRRPQSAFGRVIGRLHPLDRREVPHRLPVPQDVRADAGDFPVRVLLALLQQVPHGAAQRI
jgi:hypothetical protein